jgi:hypothetical protein
MNITVLIFGLFAFLFFIVSLYSGTRWRVVFFNIVFLILCYVSISLVIGEAKPVFNVPLYNHAAWDDKHVYVVGGWWDKKYIYLLIKEDEKVITYVWTMNQRFLDEIKKANAEMSARSGGDRWGFGLGNGVAEGLDTTTPSVILPPPIDEHPITKPLEEDTSTLHHYEVN